MTMLSDRDIVNAVLQQSLSIKPVEESLFQPASVDLTLDSMFYEMHPSSKPIDPENAGNLEEFAFKVNLFEDNPYMFCPGSFLIASTAEYVTLSDSICGILKGKSSLGRLGVVPHLEAGLIDPGFQGKITLEIKNFGTRPVLLRAGMKIAQISFFKMSSPCSRPYGHPDLGSKYQNQTEATLSKGVK